MSTPDPLSAIRAGGGLGWHFVRPPLPGVLRDGLPVVLGEWRRHEGPLVPCESGLHLCDRALDALHYAPGVIVCRVEWRGECVKEADKRCVRERRVLWSIYAEPVLPRFARACALDVIHLWKAPAAVQRYLVTGDDSLRAAAWAAAWDISGAAARATSWDIAGAAARDAAWDAAWAATWDAAGTAARAASWDAARAAAWDAAGAVGGDWQDARLELWLTSAHEGRLDLGAPLEVQ